MGFFSVGGDLFDKCPKFKLALDIIGILISATGLALGFYFDFYSTPIVIMLWLDLAMTGLGFIDALFTIGATLCCVIFRCKCRNEEDGKNCCTIIFLAFFICLVEFIFFGAGLICSGSGCDGDDGSPTQGQCNNESACWEYTDPLIFGLSLLFGLLSGGFGVTGCRKGDKEVK